MRPLLLLLLLPATGLAATIRVEGPANRKGWYEQRMPGFVAQVQRELGDSTGPSGILVVLATSDEQFREDAGRPPEWAAAVALPGRATLVVRLSALGPATGTDAASVLRHELVHLLLPYRIGRGTRVPLWFEEGLAQLLGGRLFRVDEQTLPLTAAAGRLLPLSSLEGVFPPDANGAALAYSEGESAVRFLLTRGDLGRFLDMVRDTGDFDAALRRVCGIDPAKLESEWERWIREEAEPWWMTILSVATIPFLLFVASLLVILAFLRVRRRNRALYDSLPE
jgi:hypothetical protein